MIQPQSNAVMRNAKKLLDWKPGFVEKAIIDTAKKYKETRKI